MKSNVEVVVRRLHCRRYRPGHESCRLLVTCDIDIADFWLPRGVQVEMRSWVEGTEPVCDFDRNNTIEWSCNILIKYQPASCTDAPIQTYDCQSAEVESIRPLSNLLGRAEQAQPFSIFTIRDRVDLLSIFETLPFGGQPHSIAELHYSSWTIQTLPGGGRGEGGGMKRGKEALAKLKSQSNLCEYQTI